MSPSHRNRSGRFVVAACLIALLFFSTETCFAQPPAHCQCLWQGPFSQVLEQADAVVIAKVIAASGNSFDIKIEDRLSTPTAVMPDYIDSFRVWGNNGKLCRPDTTDFVPGTRWAFALNKIDSVPEGGFDPATPNISYGREGDFYLSQCGSFWLRVQGEVLLGNLVSDRRWSWQDDDSRPVSVSTLEKYLNKQISIETLKEHAHQPDQLKQLMQQTRQFLQQQ